MKENYSLPQVIKQKYPQLIGLKKLREYKAIPLDIRSGLNKLWSAIEQNSNTSPFLDEVYELSDLFEQARSIVEELWQKEMEILVKQFLSDFANNPEASSELIYALTNEDVSRSISINYFGALEDLTIIDKEAWAVLLAVVSEKQNLIICILDKWISDNRSNIEFIKKLEELEVSIPELEIVIELADSIGELVDLAYVKQVMLSEDILNIEKPEAQEYKRVYADSQGRYYSNSEIFTYEIEVLVSKFKEIAEDIIYKCKANVLPSNRNYERLAQYLQKIALAYKIKGTDIHQLNKSWQECDEVLIELLKTNCPIFVFPQHISALASGNIMDLELRINMRTKETRDIEERYEQLLEHVAEINMQYGFDRKPPLLVVANQPSAHGTNLYWRTRGEELGGKLSIVHPEPIEKVAELNEIPLIEKLFPNALENVGIKRYLRATFNETIRHELGHAVLPLDEPIMQERIGKSEYKYIIEELKAETVNMLILQADKDMPLELKYEKVLAKIGTCLDVFMNKSHEEGSSGERYYIPALLIMDELLQSNVISRNSNGTYEIEDPELGIQSIAQIGKYILDNFYGSTLDNYEEMVSEYVSKIRQMLYSPTISQLLSDLTLI